VSSSRRPARPSRVEFPCPGCRARLERPFPGVEPPPACATCGAAVTLRATALLDGAVAGCPACGHEMLYRQKDFRQAIGCLVVLAAALLAPFTYYLSLVAAALVDLALYHLAGDVIICYRVPCRAHVRGLPAGPKVGAFDLSIHDYHRMLARREVEGLGGVDERTGPPRDAPPARPG